MAVTDTDLSRIGIFRKKKNIAQISLLAIYLTDRVKWLVPKLKFEVHLAADYFKDSVPLMFSLKLNCLTSKRLICPDSITAESNIKVVRIMEMIPN